MLNKESITIGADPEGFFVDEGGNPIPSIGLLGGTKSHPRPQGVGHVQEDNVMFEFNIPPADDSEKFSYYIQSMLDEMRSIAKKNYLELQISPYAEFKEKQLIHPQAQAIGCEPDYNAWTNRPNAGAQAWQLGNIRVAGGHVHIGLPSPNKFPGYRALVARACDLYLGLPSVLLDKDQVRRKWYGKAGAYRPKPYGLEYRTLSNFWIKSPVLQRWVFNQAYRAAAKAQAVASTLAPKGALAKSIQEAINSGDSKLAKQVMDAMPVSFNLEEVLKYAA